ncbi:MAG TPA: tetratricopeptide repeat protein [Thermoanaerobaculia bacterium]|jgi:tetratricopeptide (TPR) repeat protein|nr:tetratricopeptide repeat protein [Thermoanaerobaculia bacterium]
MSRSSPTRAKPRAVPSAPLAGFTLREAAGLVGITEPRLRAWVRSGILTPGTGTADEPRFHFQDLVLLRAARELNDARVPARRIRHALERLREQLPQGRSLSAVRILAEGGEVVARDERSMWIPASGQELFDFAVADLAREAAPIARRSAARLEEERDLDAEDWYRLGCELEETDTAEAERAYGRALALSPDHVDAHLNLGRLRHEAGAAEEAERHYRAALAASPGNATAAFDLGVALEDLGRLEEAVASYYAALEADPGYVDAHWNLAGVAEKMGATAEAIRHLSAYKSWLDGRR